MKNIVVFGIICAFIMLFTGCTAVDSLASGISSKSITGSGTVSKQKAGLNTTTNTPELESLVITGKYASAKDDQSAIQYSYRKGFSFWNFTDPTVEIDFNAIISEPEKVDAIVNSLITEIKDKKANAETITHEE